jgi:hypothetical protein
MMAAFPIRCHAPPRPVDPDCLGGSAVPIDRRDHSAGDGWMRVARGFWLVAAGLACLLPVDAGWAQVNFDAPGLLLKKPKPGPPDVKAQPLAWPRLDPGAVLCRSEADLERLAANRHGGPGGGPAECRIVSQPTAIQIVTRRGPGRTEVQVTGANETGWTDAWLPSRAPASAAQ